MCVSSGGKKIVEMLIFYHRVFLRTFSKRCVLLRFVALL
jgi:hypothetical protein